MRMSAAPLIFAMLFAFSMPDLAKAQVTVSGHVFELTATGYQPVSGVHIQAYRQGPVLKMPVVTGPLGGFNFVIADGDPFDVAFASPTLVPELHSLAGKKGTTNDANVSLLTVSQAKGGNTEKVTAKIKYILDQIGTREGDPIPDDMRRVLRQLSPLNN
jgi:hypothetical protein